MSHHPHCGRCGHVLDHKDKPCGHTRTILTQLTEDAEPQLTEVPCRCGEGILADVLICRQNGEIINTLHRIQGLLMFAHGIEVSEQGDMRKAPPQIHTLN